MTVEVSPPRPRWRTAVVVAALLVGAGCAGDAVPDRAGGPNETTTESAVTATTVATSRPSASADEHQNQVVAALAAAGIGGADASCETDDRDPYVTCTVWADAGTGTARVHPDGRIDLLGVVDIADLVETFRLRSGLLDPAVDVELDTCDRYGVVLLADGERFGCVLVVDGRPVDAVIRGHHGADGGWVLVDRVGDERLDLAADARNQVLDEVDVVDDEPVVDAVARRDAMLAAAERHASLALDDFGLPLVFERAWPAAVVAYGHEADPRTVSFATGILDPQQPPGGSNPYWAAFVVADPDGTCAGGVTFLTEEGVTAVAVDVVAPCRADGVDLAAVAATAGS